MNTPATISVLVNGEACELPVGTDLAQLVGRLAARGVCADSLATAVNGEFVARGLRTGHTLLDGDRVQCFQPIVGG
ncbi:MAG: thiamine biosynthesis protein ThiS [Aquabacterium sp.]|jgi:sulfur carrier protein|nr:MAG: thiamine biosynthesis protein ThiS [Aquabacterium sp.]